MTQTILYLFSFFAAQAVTWAMIRAPLLDHPNHRSSHSVATPRAGGVAILALFIFAVGVAIGLGEESGVEHRVLWSLLLAATTVSIVSLYDDITQRAFVAKFIAQLLAVLILFQAGMVIRLDPLFTTVPQWLVWLSYPVTLLWVVGLINAYNFMDGLDGLAAGCGLVAAAGYSILLASQGVESLAMVTAVTACGIAGFLWFNFPPARIFMGDVGSALLGFLFAALPLAAIATVGSTASPGLLLAMPLILFHFIFDTLYTLSHRWRAGKRLTEAHREHLYQRLQQSGFSHLQVSAILTGFTLIHVVLVLASEVWKLFPIYWIVPVVVMIQLLYARFVKMRSGEVSRQELNSE